MADKVISIVLTGGPCAGKTTAKTKLIDELTEKLGYQVLWIPESSTELLANGIVPDETVSNTDFEWFLLKKQIAKEELYHEIADAMEGNVVILHDRGIMDNAAYLDDELMDYQLSQCHLSRADAFSRYDAVLHLRTAAYGAESAYQWAGSPTCNNPCRRETPEEARERDDETLRAWMGHPHLRVFGNDGTFEEKIAAIVAEAFSVIGEPIPTEIERKLLIKMPDIDALGVDYTTSEITQIYLVDNGATERRIRRRGSHEHGWMFTYTEKIELEDGTRAEYERKIDYLEYLRLSEEREPGTEPLAKTRYNFVFENSYFEMDVYPFEDDYAILEIELSSLNDDYDIPDGITVVADVTDSICYRNKYIARRRNL